MDHFPPGWILLPRLPVQTSIVFYPVYSRVYQGLLTVSYLVSSRDPVPDLSTAGFVKVS